MAGRQIAGHSRIPHPSHVRPWVVVLFILVAIALVAAVFGIIAVVNGSDTSGDTTTSENVNLDALADHPLDYEGQAVAVTGPMTARLEDNVIGLRGDVLVVSTSPVAGDIGKSVTVTGTVRRFSDLPGLNLGVDFSSAKYGPWEDRPVIILDQLVK